MAAKRKLKVFRTPIGFHDAYVAASSRRAALEAWGSDADLFARGIAELVTDDALTAEPLASPGQVIKRLRGSAEEQLAALPAAAPSPKRPGRRSSDRKAKRSGSQGEEAPASSKKTPKSKPRPRSKPRPSRAALDRAEQGLEALVAAQAQEEAALREREQALERTRRDLNTRHQRDRKTAELRVRKAREAHTDALQHWIDDQG
jgi:hypothetical protein